MKGGRGNSFLSCDFGGPTITECFRSAGANFTSIIGGNMEFYGGEAAIHNDAAQSVITLSGVFVAGFGNPDAYSLKLAYKAAASVTSCHFGVRAGNTLASIKQNDTISRNLILHSGRHKVDQYNSSGNIRISTFGGSTLASTNSQGSGELANEANHGNVWRMVTAGKNDELLVGLRRADQNYYWGNLFKYLYDVDTKGSPAFLTTHNTFTNIVSSKNTTFPGFRITTGPYSGAATQAGMFIVTSQGSGATGTTTNDSLVVAKAGGDLDFATSPSGTQIKRGAFRKTGALNLVPIAEPAGKEGDIYMDSTTHKLRCHDGTRWNNLF